MTLATWILVSLLLLAAAIVVWLLVVGPWRERSRKPLAKIATEDPMSGQSITTVDQLISDSIADQIAHETEMRRFNFNFRKDQRHRAILQRVERKVGKSLSANAQQVILERIRDRDQ